MIAWLRGSRGEVTRGLARMILCVAFFVPTLGNATTLWCRNGDRLAGEIVSETEAEVVFDATNFGRVRVKREAVARIEAINGDTASTVPTSACEAGKAPLRQAAVAHSDWRGRVAITIDRTRSAGHQDSLALDLRLQREWKRDEVKIESTYDLRRDDRRRNADTLKTSTQWVRKVSDRYFGTYRAISEWNRSTVYNGRDTSYFLLQQEFGAGVSFAVANGRRVRLGLSENTFNLWVRPNDLSTTGNNESVFAEVEWALPWDARLVHRGVVFYSRKHGTIGVENSVELSRRISRTLSLSLKHELREDMPDVRLQDYNNLRLLLGYDF